MQDRHLIYRGGCDLTFIKPELLDLSPCISARYDAGICKHRKERLGVIEVYEISKEQVNNWNNTI